MTSSQLIDGASAIWSKDADAFRKALAQGWRLPSLDMQPGHGRTDLSLILRVVAYGWEGWRIWAHKCPEVSRNPIVLEAVISQCQSELLAEILEQNDGHLEWNEDYHALGPMHLLFQLIGSPLGPQVADAHIVRTAQLLGEAGIKTMEPYPGDYEPDGLNPPGHTLWTWALLWGAWGVVEGLASELKVGDEALRMPKAQQALDRWFEKAWVPSWAHAGVPSGGWGRQVWLSWMNEARFSAWLANWSRINEMEIADVLVALPAPYQAIAWQRWLAPKAPGAMPLLELVSSLLPLPRIRLILEAIQSHVPPELWEHSWRLADEYGLDAPSVWNAKQFEAKEAAG